MPARTVCRARASMSLVRWGVAAALTSAVGGYFAVAQGAAKKKKQQELEMELMLNSYISTDSSAGTAAAAPPAAGADLLADLEPLTGGVASPPVRSVRTVRAEHGEEPITTGLRE